MKKIYKKILTAALASLGLCSNAQVSNYVFTQFSGSYTAVSGGSVFGTTASDDQVFVDPLVPAGVASGGTGPGLPIGFTFTFNSIPFDRFGINNNGWIFLGQTTATPGVNSNSSSGYTGISATSTAPGNLQHRIAGFSRDIQGQAGGDLRVETIGTSPNQTCVIQWTNYRKFGATGDIMNFQIRLCETTNIVEVIYGNYINNATASTCEVGLRGATNADFNNRIVNGTISWATSVPGTANNSNCAFNSALVPASGQVYRWIPPSPCAGNPAANMATSIQTVICSNGNALLALATSYTNTGLAYQWLSSTTSSVGPFTPVAGATLSTFAVSGQTASTWYQAAITCTNTSSTINSGSHGILIAGTTTNSIPYFEGFENIVINNNLPNCSWSASNPSVICQTYLSAQANNRIPFTGSKFASFKSGTNITGDYFYTNGLQMEPGITYSAAIKYITDGLVGWSNLAIMVGTSQAVTSLTNIASITGAVSGQFYQTLSGTFTVPASGLYYVAIKCIGSAAAQFLTFDDVSVTIPCQLNAPAITLTAANSTICSGSSVLLTASGANLYSWNAVPGTFTMLVSPLVSTTYMVAGTSNMSGCTGNASITIQVNPKPILNTFTQNNSICIGSPATLYAFSDNSSDNFQWNTGQTGPSIIVSPTVNTTYNVIAVRNNGCSTTQSISISVKQLPLVFAQSSNSGAMCVGESVSLIASGAGLVSYVWSSNNINISSQIAIVSPMMTTSYTLTATDANGCKNTAQVTQVVNSCVGIAENNGSASMSIFPNPGSGQFTLQSGNTSEKQIVISDLSGKIIQQLSNSDSSMKLDLSALSNGVYFVKVSSDNGVEVLKVIKQ